MREIFMLKRKEMLVLEKMGNRMLKKSMSNKSNSREKLLMKMLLLMKAVNSRSSWRMNNSSREMLRKF